MHDQGIHLSRNRMQSLLLEELEGIRGGDIWSTDISIGFEEYMELFLRQFYEAYALGVPGMFADFLHWSRSLIKHHGMKPSRMNNFCEAFERVLEKSGETAPNHPLEFFQKECSRESGEEDAGRSHLEGDDPLRDVRKDFFESLLGGDRRRAGELVDGAVEEGTSVKNLYTKIFQPSLYEVGRLWQLNQINVAQEHYCSAAVQSLMSQLYPLSLARTGWERLL
ncbi:MAG: B12-binding domain-containing protein [Balneolaceae bacterium]|nr:B12-binding domain-containing protein [Balneolaceae bacterium]